MTDLQAEFNEILPPMVAEIGWSHNLLIMKKCKDQISKLLEAWGVR